MKRRIIGICLGAALLLSSFQEERVQGQEISVFEDTLVDTQDTDVQGTDVQEPEDAESGDVDIADEEETEPEPVKVSASKVTKAYVVGKKNARIDWSKSGNAEGYELYRRTGSSGSWKKITTVTDTKRLYAYDTSVVANKTYYYTVKAYVKSDGKKVYADFDTKGFKAKFKKVTVGLKKGDYKTGSVYGPALTQKELSQVKEAVQRFCDTYITSDMTDVEKAICAQLYLARNFTYAASWAENRANTAWGALVYKNSNGIHEAQCSGFARGYKALCDGMGVECRYVHANSKSANPSHQWNEVKIGKKWYIVDPQCNASSGFLAFFLCSGNTYTSYSGMTWDKGSYPTVSSKDYDQEKLEKAFEGYKVQRVYKKIFK